MRKSSADRAPVRLAGVESCEARVVMSAQPLAHFIVDDVQADHQVSADAQPGDLVLHMSDAHQMTGVDRAHEEFGFNGAGQTVVVIDTGVAHDHTAFGDRYVGGFDFAEGDANAYDDYSAVGGHGTHVAGIIASDDPVHTGVASGVDIIGLRVFNDASQAQFDWVVDALDWVHEHRNDFRNPITAVNLSLGTDWNSADVPGWAMLEEEFRQLENDGIFISVSAGNSYASFAAPGLSYPAASPYVVPVMSAAANAPAGDDGELSWFSQRHQRAIAAPGDYITSTVPDYLGFDSDTLNDDYRAFSGTSMAAPYVAGASVLLREAYAFMGQENVNQDTIYSLMRDTADVFHSSSDNAYYLRLNVYAALEAIIPDAEGDDVSSARDWGTIRDTASFEGIIGKLSDRDVFNFTADVTGTATFSLTSQETAAVWASEGMAGSIDGNEWAIDVVAGQSYSVAVSAGEGLTHYQIDAVVEETQAAVDLGVVQLLQSDGHVIDGSGRFQFTATRDGIFTVDAAIHQSAGSVSFAITNGDGQIIGSGATSGSRLRLDVDVSAGETYLLEIVGDQTHVDLTLANLLGRDGNAMTLFGTDGDDAFVYRAGTRIAMSVNGLAYYFDGSQIASVDIEGGEGRDSLDLRGTGGREDVSIYADRVEMTGATASFTADSLERINFRGEGGDDRVQFFGTAGDEVFAATINTTSFYQDRGFRHTVQNVSHITADGGGGRDEAKFYGSAGDDYFYATANFAYLEGEGFHFRANNFDSYAANGHSGGHDRADLFDTPATDRLYATGDRVKLVGGGTTLATIGFDEVRAHATAGGRDGAFFYDTAGDDLLSASADHMRLSGTGYSNEALGFELYRAWGYGGGHDRAELFDSPEDDVFFSYESYVKFYGGGTDYQVRGFEDVTLSAIHGGYDTTIAYDSLGNDRFTIDAGGTMTAMRGQTVHRIEGMESLAASARRGFDQVEVEVTAGGNRLYATPGMVGVQAHDQVFRLLGFDEVEVRTTPGDAGERDVVYYLDEFGRRISADQAQQMHDYVLNLEGDWVI